MLFLLFFLRVLMAQDMTNLDWFVVNDTVMVVFHHLQSPQIKKVFFFRAMFQRRTMVVLHPYDFVQRSV